MPLEDYLQAVNDKLTSQAKDAVLLSMQHSLQAYVAAVKLPKNQAPAVRSALGALKVISSSEQSESVPGLLAAVNREAVKWDDNQFKYKPSNVVIGNALDGGKAGSTFEAQVDGKGKKVFKAEPNGYGYNLDQPKDQKKIPAMPREMQMDELGSRLSARVVASYKLDKALGCSVLARTRFAAATINEGQALFGSLQDWTGGESLNSMLKDDTRKIDLLERYKNPEVVRQLQELQLVDYITGQTDRHGDNIHITADNKILGIDHDFSFSGTSLGKMPNFPVPGNKNKGLPTYIDSNTKSKHSCPKQI